MKLLHACFGWFVVALVRLQSSVAADGDAPVLKVPDGFSIELVAGPPLVERPIVAAFDDEGRLYVAESSGSNDPSKSSSKSGRIASCGWKMPMVTATSIDERCSPTA